MDRPHSPHRRDSSTEPELSAAIATLTELAKELSEAWHPAHAASLLHRLSRKDGGLLPHLQRLVQDAARWGLDLPDQHGMTIYAELTHAAARLESVRAQIEGQATALTRHGNPTPFQKPPAHQHRFLGTSQASQPRATTPPGRPSPPRR